MTLNFLSTSARTIVMGCFTGIPVCRRPLSDIIEMRRLTRPQDKMLFLKI
jgi:hypothetical protein